MWVPTFQKALKKPMGFHSSSLEAFFWTFNKPRLLVGWTVNVNVAVAVDSCWVCFSRWFLGWSIQVIRGHQGETIETAGVRFLRVPEPLDHFAEDGLVFLLKVW